MIQTKKSYSCEEKAPLTSKNNKAKSSFTYVTSVGFNKYDMQTKLSEEIFHKNGVGWAWDFVFIKILINQTNYNKLNEKTNYEKIETFS